MTMDMHSSGRVATGGADAFVRMWQLEGTSVDFLSTLKYHDGPVNCVRFSPDGTKLCSAGEDGVIVLWTRDTTNTQVNGAFVDDDLADNKERWKVLRHFGASTQGIYSISWSPSSQHIVSGSLDNSVAIWDARESSSRDKIEELMNHHHFVQGVAWDPLGQYIASSSSDKSCTLWKKGGGANIIRGTFGKGEMLKLRYLPEEMYTRFGGTLPDEKKSQNKDDQAGNVDNGNNAKEAPTKKRTRNIPMFLDENVNSFFRRLEWSPDGNLLFAPCGIFGTTLKNDVPLYTTYIMSRTNLTEPVAHIPSAGKASVAVRCNPLLYKLPQGSDWTKSIFGLPYQIIFAVGTLDSVIIYSSLALRPLLVLKDIHYAPITDLAWSLISSLIFFLLFYSF